MTCECGFPGADRNRLHHRLSVYHRQHRTIRGLLSNKALSFADIGDRLGITRERVRQIARQLGMESGLQRREQRALRNRMPAWQERKGYRELIDKGRSCLRSITRLVKTLGPDCSRLSEVSSFRVTNPKRFTAHILLATKRGSHSRTQHPQFVLVTRIRDIHSPSNWRICA
jgi:hypothetical protein